jgi:hypothetical protein
LTNLRTSTPKSWPLFRYLLDDPVYHAMYLDDLAETVAGLFNPDETAETYRMFADLIAPYAIAGVGKDAFHSAAERLIEQADPRADLAEALLASN